MAVGRFPGLRLVPTQAPPPASPSVPTVTLTVLGPSSIQVVVASTPSSGQTITQYNISRATTEFGAYSEVAAQLSGTFVDTGLSAGTTYWYKALAQQTGGGISSYSSPSAATTSAAASGFNALAPRLGAYALNDPNYDTLSNRDYWKRFSLLIMTHWDGWEVGRSMPMRDVISYMKSTQDPTVGGLECYIYVNLEAIEAVGVGADAPVWNIVNNNNWWIYRSGISGQKALSYFSSSLWCMNFTTYCPVDGSGDNFAKAGASHFTNWIFNGGSLGNTANPNWDGIFWDNVFTRPYTHDNNPTVDYDRNGDDDPDDDLGVIAAVTGGYRQSFDRFRSLQPTKYVFANCGGWSNDDLNLYTTPAFTGTWDYSKCASYLGQVDGGVFEYGFDGLGPSSTNFSKENQNPQGWYHFCNQLRYMAGALKGEKLIVDDRTIVENPTLPDDFRRLRYGLGTMLVASNFWYYPHPDSYSANVRLPEYDEFTNAGTRYGWLGAYGNSGQSAPQIAAWNQGVYWRQFPNGSVFVNPKSNGDQTFTSPVSGRRIAGRSGRSDLSVNNGAVVTAGVTTITLKDRDAIFIPV